MAEKLCKLRKYGGGSGQIGNIQLIVGYSTNSVSRGSNIVLPIDNIVFQGDVVINNNVITFNRHYSGTIRADAVITTGQTQDFRLLVKKNGSTYISGTSVRGYSNVKLNVSGDIAVNSGDSISIVFETLNYGGSAITSDIALL